MNEDELFDAVVSATEVLRVEALDAYDADSDLDYVDRFRTGAPKPDPSEKAEWLGLISAAAQRGHPWRRLRVVSRPVTEYVRYACEWGYTDNVAAGEDVRILDLASPQHGRMAWFALTKIGDVYALDQRAHLMRYDERGAFEGTEEVPGWKTLERIEMVWHRAVPFTQWWAANPDLHRNLAPA